MTLPGLAVEQPTEQLQTVGNQIGPIEMGAGGQKRLGQCGVCIAKPCLRPWPGRVGARRTDRLRRVGKKRSGRRVARVLNQNLGSAQCRERHRTRPRGTLGRSSRERRQGRLAELSIGSVSGGSSERPETSAPAVLDTGPVEPAAVGAAPIAHPSIGCLSVGEKSIRHLDEVENGAGWPRFAARDDQHPRQVVGAEPMFRAGHRVVRVFERANRRRETQEMIEGIGDHDIIGSLVANSRAPSAS